MEVALQQIEMDNQVDAFIDNMRRISDLMVKPMAQQTLLQQLQATITGLKSLGNINKQMVGDDIPAEVANRINRGINPAIYDQEKLTSLTKKIEKLKTSVEEYKPPKVNVEEEFGKQLYMELAPRRNSKDETDEINE